MNESVDRLGRISSLALVVIGVMYFLVLAIWFASHGLVAPIVDPTLAIMETLTLLSAPLMVVMMAAVHAHAADARKVYGVIALAFMILVAGMTSAVHFVELTAVRQLGSSGIMWPSRSYAVELLAWNPVLGLSLLFAAPVFPGNGVEAGVRRGLYVSGVLCLAGVVGPVVGHMRLQLIGLLGYAVVFPIVCYMLFNVFRGGTAVGSAH